MTAQAAITRAWRVGSRTCSLSMPREARGLAPAIVEWTPDMPGRLTANELAEYQAGRNAALAEIAQELGICVAVVDL